MKKTMVFAVQGSSVLGLPAACAHHDSSPQEPPNVHATPAPAQKAPSSTAEPSSATPLFDYDEAKHLASQGVAVSSIEVKSRGELDATGTDPASWQLDRRAELKAAAM